MTKLMSDKKKNKFPSDYAKFSNIAFKMAIIIFLGVFGGYYIDKLWLPFDFPLATIILSLSSVVLAIFIIIKGLL